MAGLPWIRVYTSLREDARSLALGDLLGKPNAWLHVMGWRLWLAANSPTGIFTGPCAELVFERAAAWDGERGKLLAAALQVGFLVHHPDGTYEDADWREQQASHVEKVQRDRRKPWGGRGGDRGDSRENADLRTGDTVTPRGRDEPPAREGSLPYGKDEPPARENSEPRAGELGTPRGESREKRVEIEEEKKEMVGSAPGELVPRDPRRDDPRPEALQEIWNELAHPDLSRWLAMSAGRRKAALRRLKERSLGEMRMLIERINLSDFCRGRNERGWRADPDWFLKPDTAGRILEGKYDNPQAREESAADRRRQVADRGGDLPDVPELQSPYVQPPAGRN